MATTLKDDDIVTAVRKNLDEIGLNDSEFDIDTEKDESELDTIIKSKIGEAYRFILTKADYGRLDSSNISEVKASSSSSPAVATIPYDSRFLYAVSSSWSYPVYDPIMWNTAEYALLKNEHTTGTAERPKVGIINSTTKGNYSVELYGTTNGTVGYIDLSASYKSGTTTLSDSLYTALIYYATSLTLLTLRDTQHAESMMEQALATLGVDVTKSSDEQ